MNSPTDLRTCALEDHHEPQRKQFHIPLYIHPAPIDADRQLDFRGWDNRHVARWLRDLTPNDCRLFCWKDCAIYGNKGLTGQDHFKLLEQVYGEWYPHRAEDQDLSHGSFFGKFMRFTPAAASLKEILCFHTALCTVLQNLEKDLGDRQPVLPGDVRPVYPRPLAEYKLRQSFLEVFIVLDAGWQEQGCLLVCPNEDVAKRYHCMEGKDIKSYDCSDYGGGMENAYIFSCSLKQAMRLVVSQNPERARRRSEYNEMLEETLGDSDER